MESEFPPAIILDSQTRTLRSTIVNDDYEISIWLPPGYDTSEQSYPALYLLDSPISFGFVIPVVLGQIWDGLVPEMVIVGIGKHIETYDEWWPIRGRDYAPVPLPSQPGSGQAAAFLEFIEAELVPFIEKDFRIDPDRSALWGHSLGGSLVLYAMFSRSSLFNHYIATSPAFIVEGETLVDYEAGLTVEALSSGIRLFVAIGSSDDEFGPNVEAFMKTIRESNYPGLDFKTAVLEGYGHISAASPGFIQGLQTVFSS